MRQTPLFFPAAILTAATLASASVRCQTSPASGWRSSSSA